jgi:hypothetical protein
MLDFISLISFPWGRVKFEGASQEYEFSSEESEGEENNRGVEHDPPDSSSPEGRVKSEGASRLLYGLVRVPLIPIVFLPY